MIFEKLGYEKLVQGARALKESTAEHEQTAEVLQESQAIFRTFVESSTDHIFMLDREGRYLFSNNRVDRIGLKSGQSLVGRHLRDVYPPDAAEFFQRQVERVFETSQTLDFEYPIPTNDGLHYHQDKLYPIFRENHVWIVGGICRDITQRKRAEEALSVSEASYRYLVEKANDIIYKTDVNGHFTFFNPVAVNKTGYSERELTGKLYLDLIRADYREDASAIYIAQFQKKHPHTYHEFPMVTKGGEEVWIGQHVQLIMEGERITGFHAIARDITRDKRAEEALRKNFDALEQKVRERTADLEEINEQLKREIEERVQAEGALKRRLDYEKMLADISTHAILVDDVKAFQEKCLGIMGNNLDLSRVYIFEHMHETDTMKNTFEWVAPGILPQKDNLQELPASTFPWWMGKMKNNEVINYEDIEDVPEKRERALLRQQSIKSILVVPLFVGSEYHGFMGFDECRYHRGWADEDVDILKATVQVITGVLDRKRAEERERQYARDLEWLSNAAMKFVELSFEDDIYQLIGGLLKELSGDSVVFVNSFESVTNSFRVRQALGIGEHVETLRKLLGRHPVGFRTPINDEVRRDLMSGKLEHVAGGIYALSAGKLPKTVAEDIERVLGWGDVHAMGFSWGGELFGSANIMTRKTGDLKGKENIIETFMQQASIAIQRRGMERAQRESEERYRAIVEDTTAMICRFLPDGTLTFVNDAYSHFFGKKGEKVLIGQSLFQIIPDEHHEKVKERLISLTEEKPLITSQHKVVTPDGALRWLEWTDHALFGEDGNVKEYQSIGQDTTERKLLEAQLLQSQKMEAIGTLAGGIAHDFNNLLMGIQGNASLMLLHTDPTHTHYENLQNIEQYVKNSADLTKQLLGFARGGRYEVKPTDINKLIKKTSRMFGRTRKQIAIQEDYRKDLWPVEIDEGQIEQVLLNIYVNASQAMPGGGYLSLKTENVSIGDIHAKVLRLEPGRWVKISVKDTGVGMDEATRQRIFEPFFTTKGMGRGAGLGLASAYGIVKGHGGIIHVRSERGHGTTFEIYLPASDKKVLEHKVLPEEVVTGVGTVLFVDDEEMIVYVGAMMLKQIGYDVIVAGSGKEAVEIYKKNRDRIDVVILDMVMPIMSGEVTYEKLKEIDPDIKVLLSSGYSLDGQAAEILEQGCRGFLQKPFDIKALSKKLRAILDEK